MTKPGRHNPGEPVKGSYKIVLSAILLFILYGSFYPFEYYERFYPGGPVAYLLSTWRDWDGHGDLLSNILLYIPFGAFAVFAIPPAIPRLACVLIVVSGGAALAAGIELAQFHLHGRVTSMGDVYADAIGSALGAGAAAIVGAGVRWPLVAELAAQPRPAMLLVCWAGYRLYPYVPAIDPGKYWHTVQALLTAPPLLPGECLRFTLVWLLIAGILDALYGFRRWLLLFPLLAAAEFSARVVLVATDLKRPDIAGAAAAFVLWPLLRFLPGRGPLLALAFAALIIALRLQPFDFTPAGRPFGWVPFNGMMHGSVEVAIQALCEKACLYGGLIWLLCRAGANLAIATGLTALLLLATSYAETCLPGRSAEITDAVMALALGGLFRLLPGEAAARPGGG